MVAFLIGITEPSQDLCLSRREPSHSMLLLDMLTFIILRHGFWKNISSQVIFKICHPSSCIHFGNATTFIILRHGFWKNISSQVIFKICRPSSCIHFGSTITNTIHPACFFFPFLYTELF